MYHLIDDISGCPMAVPPAAFAEQMSELAEGGYTPVDEQQVRAAIHGRHTLPRDAVLITFDDGYTNTIDVALPILEEYGLPAVMAVCGGYTSAEHLPRRTGHASEDFADAEAVRAWHETGRDVAAHSYSHLRLTELTETQLRWQLDVDREILSGILGEPPQSFAYPFGSRDDRVRDAVSRRYRMALSTDSRRPLGVDRPYDVPRIQISPDWNLAAFRAALSAQAPPWTAQHIADRVARGWES
ncbi:polysaccharide deacetylase family protein [Streptomyces radiopugnans]|uniref:polysaccharide deacetylase family protein n=1 Tax=Streptomyces radiopugnans TaxID=403935 RepID=UPI003F1A49A6